MTGRRLAALAGVLLLASCRVAYPVDDLPPLDHWIDALRVSPDGTVVWSRRLVEDAREVEPGAAVAYVTSSGVQGFAWAARAGKLPRRLRVDLLDLEGALLASGPAGPEVPIGDVFQLSSLATGGLLATGEWYADFDLAAVKLDAALRPVWSRPLGRDVGTVDRGGRSAVDAAGGSFLASGSWEGTTERGWVAALDHAGRTRWTRTLGAETDVQDVATLGAGCAVVGLQHFPLASGLQQAFVVALDEAGEVRWERPLARGGIYDVRCAGTNGDRVVLAFRLSRGGSEWDTTVTAFNVAGETVWTTELDGMSLEALVAMEDGGVLILGSHWRSGWQLCRLTHEGQVRWRRRLPEVPGRPSPGELVMAAATDGGALLLWRDYGWPSDR